MEQLETPPFFRTTKEKRHSHLIYIAEDGSAYVSRNQKHTHPISWQEEQATESSETGEKVVISESGWRIGETNGHTHDIGEPLVPKAEKEEKRKDEDVIEENRRYYRAAKDIEKDFRDRGKKAEGMATGFEMWERGDKDSLKAEGRAALSINEAEPKLDILRGHQAQNRYDLRFFPGEEGDQKVADIINLLVKNIWNQNNADHEETEVFEDQMIPGRGIFDIQVSFDDNIEGDIIIESGQWDEFFLGSHRKKDGSDCEFFVKAKWFSAGKIKQYWPKKAKDITKELDRIIDPAGGGIDYDKYDKGGMEIEDAAPDTGYNADLVNVARKEFRVLEVWKKEYLRYQMIVNFDEDFRFSGRFLDDADIAAIKTVPGFDAMPKKEVKIRISSIAGNVVLEDGVSDYFDDLPAVPAYGKKRGKRVWGKVQPVMDMLRMNNKISSQIIDIGNKCANYGWFYDSSTFPTPQAAAKFRKNAGKPGFVQELTDVNRKPEKVEGSKLPAELIQMAQSSSTKIAELMNVNGELLGPHARAESGIALARIERHGLVGNEFLFDNLALTKRRVGKLIVSLIQKLYTPERIARLVNRQIGKTQGVQIGGEPAENYSKEDIIALLENQDLTKYDLEVGEAQYSPTAKLANFAMWKELAQEGMPIPPEMLLEMAPLADKDKYLPMIKAFRQQQAQAEGQKYQTEIQKAQIAASKDQGQPPSGP